MSTNCSRAYELPNHENGFHAIKLGVSDSATTRGFKMPNLFSKVVGLSFILTMILASTFTPVSHAVLNQQSLGWYYQGDTNIKSIALGDVNADTVNDIVTVGYYNDGTRWVAQICVFNAATWALENIKSWYWISDTQIASVAIGDVNNDGSVEIVTAGCFFDGTRWVTQVITWNGATLAALNIQSWYWLGSTQISSIAIGDANNDGLNELVTGGSYFDGTRTVAQIIVFNGATLAPLTIQSWYWLGNTYINSIAISKIGTDTTYSVITGGVFFDGIRNNAQLITWDGSTLTAKTVTSWYHLGNTEITSITTGDFNADNSVEIISGGSFFDGIRHNAQLIGWTGTLTPILFKSWYWTSDTLINTVAFGDVTNDGIPDIVTGGSYFDGTRNFAQITAWNGSTYVQDTGVSWYYVASTWIESIAIGRASTATNSIVAGGNYFDGIRDNTLLTSWG